LQQPALSEKQMKSSSLMSEKHSSLLSINQQTAILEPAAQTAIPPLRDFQRGAPSQALFTGKEKARNTATTCTLLHQLM